MNQLQMVWESVITLRIVVLVHRLERFQAIPTQKAQLEVNDLLLEPRARRPWFYFQIEPIQIAGLKVGSSI